MPSAREIILLFCFRHVSTILWFDRAVHVIQSSGTAVLRDRLGNLLKVCVLNVCIIYICLTSVTCVKCDVHSTLCWKIGNISGSS